MDNYHYLFRHVDPYRELELCLKDILTLVKPLEDDRLKRWNAVNELQTRLHSVERLKDVTVRPFGSFISNLYSKEGDVDISVELSHGSSTSTSRKSKKSALMEIMKALRNTGIARNFRIIPHARVPLLIYQSNRHNISCDVTVDNYIGYMKSKILLWINDIDERFRDMVLLIKEWAKAHNINDPKTGTLNSYSLCLLVIFHFQTCDPAILPPLEDIYPRNIVDIYSGNLVNSTGSRFKLEWREREINDVCLKKIEEFKSSRKRNQSSLSKLLISFFEKFSKEESLSPKHVINTYTGKQERIKSNSECTNDHKLFIQDPFQQPDNAAKAVRLRELILNAFSDTSRKLSTPNALSDRNILLSCLVRSNMGSMLKARTTSRHSAQEGQRSNAQIEYSGYETQKPLHGQFQEVLKLDRHNSAQEDQRIILIPRTAYSGYANHVPLHDQFQNVLKLDGQFVTPSSEVTLQRPTITYVQGEHTLQRPAIMNAQGQRTLQRPAITNAQGQQRWRPKYSNN